MRQEWEDFKSATLGSGYLLAPADESGLTGLIAEAVPPGEGRARDRNAAENKGDADKWRGRPGRFLVRTSKSEVHPQAYDSMAVLDLKFLCTGVWLN